MHPPAAARSR